MSYGDWLELHCHPSQRPEAARTIRARVNRLTADQLRISFELTGELRKVVIPAPSAPQIGRELWRHTCFEAFVVIDRRPAYHEFNFAPSGEWTIYAMRGYRDGSPLTDETMRPEIVVRSAATHLELDAVVNLARLSPEHVRAPLRLGLSAVIEANDGLSCWALAHRADKPDFHDPQGFLLRLQPPA